MNLKNIMIISADNNLRRYIVRGFSSMIKSLSAFVLSFIILTSSIFSQYLVATVSAAEVGAIVAVDLIVELAVTGGIVAGIFRTAEIIQGEVSSGKAFGSDGLDSYALNINGLLTDGVSNGTITNAQAGTVNKLSGVPVEIICPVYGIYQFLCTNELCNKIRTENPQTEQAVKQIVNAYWSSVNILDQRTFEEIASDPRNWVTSLDALNNAGVAITGQAVFDTYGQAVSEPSSSFFETGEYMIVTLTNGRVDTLHMDINHISDYDDFVAIQAISGGSGGLEKRFQYGLFGHLITETDPTIYSPIQSYSISFSSLRTCNVINGIKSVSLDFSRWVEVGWPVNTAGTRPDFSKNINLSAVFPNWGDLRGIESTDAIDLVDWCYGDARFWNTDILDLAIDEIADTVDAQIDTGEGTDAIDVPIDLPIDIPVEGEGDVAWPSDITDEDFDDPPAYPRTDEWADVDETDWPTFDPEPEDPNPEDPDPDNPGDEDPGARPELMLPVLGGLFPFCIPQDVYNTIRVFNSTAQEPVWDIPLNLSVGNRQLTNTTLHIDLTEYGLDGFFSTLRVVQIVIFIVGLAVFTKHFIF